MIIENGVLMNVSEEDIPENGIFVVPNGVTEIGYEAFLWCNTLKKIKLPDNIIKIGNYSFSGCRSLKEIYIPDSVTTIGNHAFYNCVSMKKIHIPDSITFIDTGAFRRCESLEEIYIPDSLTTLGSFSFYRCKALKRIHLPKNMTSIMDFTFYGCESLLEIQVPGDVTYISEYCFSNCINLQSIKWGEDHYNVRCIDDYCMHIKNEKYLQDIKILRCSYFPNNGVVYVAEKDGCTAHGKTVREAVEDLYFKMLKKQDIAEHIQRIAAQGYMDANDYRLLTGACREGTNRFLEANNLTWDDKMSVQDVLKLVEGEYGFERFREVADQILELT